MQTEQYAVLAIVVTLAFALGTIARKVRMSAAVGYLLAGIVVGLLLRIPEDVVTALGIISEISIALLLFEIGFEIHVKNIQQLRGSPAYVTALELTMSLALVASAGFALGIDTGTSIVFGVSAAFASTVFTYKLMEEVPPTREDVKNLVLMTLAAEDVAIVVTLTILSSNARGPIDVAEIAVIAMAVSAGIYWGGGIILPRVIEGGESGLILLISYGLVAAFISSALGLSPSIGAFVAGVTVSKIPKADEVMEKFRPVRAVFILLFLIFMGLETAAAMPGTLSHPSAIVMGLLIVLIHIISKGMATLIGGGVGLKYGIESGLYLSTISELSLIIAYTAVTAGTVEPYVLPAIAIGVSVASMTASFLVNRKYAVVVHLLRIIPRKLRWVIDTISLSIQRQSSSRLHGVSYDLFHIITHSAGEVVIATAIVLEALRYLPSAFPAYKAVVLAAVLGTYLAAAARLIGRAVKASGRLADILGAPKGLKKIAEASVAAVIAGISAEVAAIILVFRYGEELSSVLGLNYSVLAPTILVLPLAVMLTTVAIAAEVIKT